MAVCTDPAVRLPCCTAVYSYFIAVLECCIGEWVVRVSLNLDDAIVEDWFVCNV